MSIDTLQFILFYSYNTVNYNDNKCPPVSITLNITGQAIMHSLGTMHAESDTLAPEQQCMYLSSCFKAYGHYICTMCVPCENLTVLVTCSCIRNIIHVCK